MNHRVQPIIAVLIALGAFGFLYVLITDPGEMAKMAVTIIVAGIIIYFIVKYVMKRNAGSEGAAFKKAAKQSRRRMKEQKAKHRAGHKGRVSHLRSVPSASKPKPMILKKKSQTQLTVIEGKKTKRKTERFFSRSTVLKTALSVFYLAQSGLVFFVVLIENRLPLRRQPGEI